MLPHENLDVNDVLLPRNLAKKYKEYIYEKSVWRVGNNDYANKLDAIIDSYKLKKPVEFVVDEKWKSIDFTKTPSDPLFELFKERAAQIRREYDYVRLLMGAGWDTHTVIQSFFEAGAKIDELIINRKFIKSPSDLCCFEETHIIPKTIEYYKDFFKDTKITIIDTDWKIFDKFYSNVNFMRYHFSTQIEFHSGLVGYNPFYFAPELLKPFDEGIRAVNVMGTEKPRILKAAGDYFYLFLDRDFKVSAPGHLEFFRDVDFPELMVAETHILLDQKLKNIPLYEAIKSIRHPIPESSWNGMVHKHPSKYFPLRIGQENNKGVAMAMEASLHDETKDLQQKWIDNIQYWVDLYPNWFQAEWIPSKFINSTAAFCISIENNMIYRYDDLVELNRKVTPDIPMSDHIHLTAKDNY